jgi:hypothetical protein
MPRKAKLDPHKAAAQAVKCDQAKARYTLMNRAVQVQTLKQYEARFERMECFRLALKVPIWSAKLFVAWLWEMKEAGYKDSEGYRAALLHCLEARQVSAAFLRSPDIIKMSQGFGLQNKLVRKPIGAITLAMLQELCTWFREKGQRPLAVLAAIIFHTQARGEEVIRMRKGDIQADGETGDLHLWFIRNDKRCKRGNSFAKSAQKLVPQNIVSLIRIIAADKKHGDNLFSVKEGFCLLKLATGIREASKALGWPAEVRFGGVHGLRHGGSRAILDRAREAVATGMANQTRGTLKHYSRANGPSV